MIQSRLVIDNYSRGRFYESHKDEFELVALSNRCDDFELLHNQDHVAYLDVEQLRELASYIEGVIGQV